MNKTIVTIIGGLLATVFFVSITMGAYLIGTYNTQVTLQTTYNAKVKANEADFDNMKKKITQVAQVSEMQMNKLKELFSSYGDSRTNKNGTAVMNWIKESIPNVDTKTFQNLQNIIVGSRDSFTSRQKELVDVSREYNQNLALFPRNLVLGMFGFKAIDPKIVTSTATEKAFETGKDDDNKVF